MITPNSMIITKLARAIRCTCNIVCCWVSCLDPYTVINIIVMRITTVIPKRRKYPYTPCAIFFYTVRVFLFNLRIAVWTISADTTCNCGSVKRTYMKSANSINTQGINIRVQYLSALTLLSDILIYHWDFNLTKLKFR